MSDDSTAPILPDDDNAITLRDVIVHMQSHFSRIGGRLDTLDKSINSVDAKVDALDVKLTSRIDALEKTLTTSIEALEEDLTATMNDTLQIRQKVGMYAGEE